jgi:hypothetical protein
MGTNAKIIEKEFIGEAEYLTYEGFYKRNLQTKKINFSYHKIVLEDFSVEKEGGCVHSEKEIR